MNCMICNEKMKKKALAGVLVDYCQKCDGVWMDKGEFEIAVSVNTSISRQILRQQMESELEIEKLQLVSYRGLCQRCGGSVSRYNFHGVSIDKCQICGGMYFEHGELVKCMNNCKSKKGWLKKLFSLMR